MSAIATTPELVQNTYDKINANLEVIRDRLGFVLPLPAAQTLERITDLGLLRGQTRLQRGIRLRGQDVGQGVEAPSRLAPLAQALEHDVPDRAPRVEARLLREVARACPPAPSDPPCIGLLETGENAAA